jgi:hypothetical protein
VNQEFYVGLAIGLLIGWLATSVFVLLRFQSSGNQPTLDEETIKPVENKEDRDALAIDPENPPTWRFYAPSEGSPVRVCTCHGLPFSPGQALMWWPVVDSDIEGEVYLLCDDGVGIKAPVTQ